MPCLAIQSLFRIGEYGAVERVKEITELCL